MEEKQKKLHNAFNNALVFAKRNYNAVIAILGLTFIFLLFAILSGNVLFSSYNLNSMLASLTPLLIICVSLTFVFAHGGMDISCGAVSALCSLAAVYIMNQTQSVFLGMTVSVVVSVAFYVVNSYVTNKFGLMAVISSLAIMFTARGIVTYICTGTPNDSMSIANTDMSLFKSNSIFMIVICVIYVAVALFLFDFTKIGKSARAIGDNEQAARLSGVQNYKTKLICYIIAGVGVGFASMFRIAAVGRVTSTTASGLEMDVIVAVVMGGLSLAGGAKTKIYFAVAGALTYTVLMKGLTVLGMSPDIVSLVKSIVFIAVVALTASQPKSQTMPR